LEPRLEPRWLATFALTPRAPRCLIRATSVRLGEASAFACASWEEIWVIPLAGSMTPYGVLLAEERVGRLLKPDENKRKPGR